MMSGEFMINPLEPKAWSENSRFENQEKETDDSPETFRKVTRLSQHISYLKDFFRAYKDFTDAEIDTIEIMLMKLYARFGIDDLTDLDKLENCDYPVMSDLYELVEKEFMAFDKLKNTSTPKKYCRISAWDCTQCARERNRNISTAEQTSKTASLSVSE